MSSIVRTRNAPAVHVDPLPVDPLPIMPLIPLQAPPPKKKRKGEVDPLNVCRSVIGLMTGFVERFEAEAHDTRVPVSEPLLMRLIDLVKPGVTIRGLVEAAIAEYLDRTAPLPPPPAPQGEATERRKLHGAELAEFLFSKNQNCHLCLNPMGFTGSEQHRPKLLSMPEGKRLVCGDCYGWIVGCTDGA